MGFTHPFPSVSLKARRAHVSSRICALLELYSIIATGFPNRFRHSTAPSVRRRRKSQSAWPRIDQEGPAATATAIAAGAWWMRT
ncbi:hypothetical protein HPP92_019468 [Vanilla planifolia]|uniref:Uncharacterized protein n=1 Tax=Vanilla planifolia TaxID=51239 RepID=A0A835Q443_VANPL|nr:hypothetical protein HPP92_019468 [Vanilla planifolia]